MITLAAGIVLVVTPNLIPGVMGVNIDKSAYIICYLLAGSEFGFAFLSFYGSKLSDPKALRVISLACIVFHGSTGVLEIYSYFQGLNAAILGNVVLRVVVIILFIYYGFYKTPLKPVSEG